MFKFFKKISRFTVLNKNISNDTSINLFNAISIRRTQAQKSLLIILSNANSIAKAFEHCSKYGKIKSAFTYTIKNGKVYLLVEFSTSDTVKIILKNTQHFDSKLVVPICSRTLWFNNSKVKGNIPIYPKRLISNSEIHLQLDMDEVKKEMIQAASISQQMNILQQKTQITDLGTRLRFYLCSLIDESLSGMFPNCSTIPFGSSLNGLGKHDSDLDMLLTLNYKQLLQQERVPQIANSNFVFDAKRLLPSDRQQMQRHLEAIATILQQFMPGCCEINRILRARVPIVRFYHDKIGLSCDLTIGSNGGLEMAELLYNYSRIEVRFKPLFFTLRYWAKHWAITHPYPGKWITNFMLAIMTIFYFDSCSGVASKDLEEILKGFYAFYESFNYKERGFCIKGSNTTFLKPDYSPLFIQNPFDSTHNIAKNVTGDQVDHLRQACRSSLWILDKNPQSILDLLFHCDVDKELLSQAKNEDLQIVTSSHDLPSETHHRNVMKSIDVKAIMVES